MPAPKLFLTPERLSPLIIPERLAEVKTLSSGEHNPGDEMCVMEAVAYVTNEPWGDEPECVCPAIAAFARSLNDELAERDEVLLPLIPRFVGTRDGREKLRASLALAWLKQVYTPAFAILPDHAKFVAGRFEHAARSAAWFLHGAPESTSAAFGSWEPTPTTVAELKASALSLLIRMIEIGEKND